MGPELGLALCEKQQHDSMEAAGGSKGEDAFLASNTQDGLRVLVDVSDFAAHPLGMVMTVAASDTVSVQLVAVREEGRALGALRNMAVDAASGDYVVQWDDDDWFHPRRIELQMAALRNATGRLVHTACFMTEWIFRLDDEFHLCRSSLWPGSLLCRRAVMPRYPGHLAASEDSQVAALVLHAASSSVAFVRQAGLYVYEHHGDAQNTVWSAELGGLQGVICVCLCVHVCVCVWCRWGGGCMGWTHRI